MDIKKLETIVYEALTTKTKHYGLNKNKGGWVKTSELIERVNFMNGFDELDENVIFKIVYKNPHYDTNLFRSKIRVTSKAIQRETYRAVIPPDKLFYKTNKRYDTDTSFIITPSEGTKYLELSSKEDLTNTNFVLTIDAHTMFSAGYKFYMLDNKYYIEKLPSKFILKVRRVG
jgi:RNA:NAD 2'-phosphotransferase (TPT1/KptA family)